MSDSEHTLGSPPGSPPSPPPPPAPPAVRSAGRPPQTWFRRVTFHSLLAGLCPLIPVPFLDDRVLASVRRKMVRELAAERGARLDPERVDLLAGIERRSRGCVDLAVRGTVTVTFKLLRKVFRKVFIFLAVKEGVDTASRVFHEGYLLHLALAWAPDWESRSAPLDSGRARTVRRAVDGTLAEVDPRPVEQAVRRVFRGSRSLLRQGARVLGRSGAARPGRKEERRAGELPEAEERQILGGVLDRLEAALWQEQGYLDDLEARFRRHLEVRTEIRGEPPPA